MGTQFITAATAVVSLVVGALLQHLLGGRAEARKQRDLLRASAYADFLRGVSALSAIHHTDSTSQDHFQALALVGDPRARIALYGSAAALRAVAEISDYPQLDTRRACQTFVRACQQMRAVSPACSPVSDEELSRVVFSQRLQDFPDK